MPGLFTDFDSEERKAFFDKFPPKSGNGIFSEIKAWTSEQLDEMNDRELKFVAWYINDVNQTVTDRSPIEPMFAPYDPATMQYRQCIGFVDLNGVAHSCPNGGRSMPDHLQKLNNIIFNRLIESETITAVDAVAMGHKIPRDNKRGAPADTLGKKAKKVKAKETVELSNETVDNSDNEVNASEQFDTVPDDEVAKRDIMLKNAAAETAAKAKAAAKAAKKLKKSKGKSKSKAKAPAADDAAGDPAFTEEELAVKAARKEAARRAKRANELAVELAEKEKLERERLAKEIAAKKAAEDKKAEEVKKADVIEVGSSTSCDSSDSDSGDDDVADGAATSKVCSQAERLAILSDSEPDSETEK